MLYCILRAQREILFLSGRRSSLEKSRIAICDICNKEIEVRWGIFASDTILRHKRAEHK